MTRPARSLLFTAKLAAMAALFWLVWEIAGGTEILDALSSASPVWLLLAAALTVPQTFLSAVRWRLVVRRLGEGLPMHRAAGEYYIAVFLNQVLPGGVAGDVTRAARHGGLSAGAGPGIALAARAVVYERTAGLMAMIALSLPGLALWRAEAAWTGALVLCLLVAIALKVPEQGAVGRFLASFRNTVLHPHVLVPQILLSGTVAASYVTVFWLCTRALAIDLPVEIAVMILPPALLAMAIPITPAGWGLREAASVGLWTAAGLSAADAAAASFLYGLVNLAASMPGAVLLLAGLGRGR